VARVGHHLRVTVQGGTLVLAAEATGLPALFIIGGCVGLIVAVGVAIGGRRDRAKKIAAFCALAMVVGVFWANLD
jgi:hypothetical protein